jgi:uncharacterized protein YceH (UPF0502 family)
MFRFIPDAIPLHLPAVIKTCNQQQMRNSAQDIKTSLKTMIEQKELENKILKKIITKLETKDIAKDKASDEIKICIK